MEDAVFNFYLFVIFFYKYIKSKTQKHTFLLKIQIAINYIKNLKILSFLHILKKNKKMIKLHYNNRNIT